jgi:hypothetical protein
VKRILAWVGGALGVVTLLRLRRRQQELPPAPVGPDPADELKRRLEEAREAPDDRDDFDAAEGQPVDEIEPTRSLAERREAVHEKAQEALGQMKPSDDE